MCEIWGKIKESSLIIIQVTYLLFSLQLPYFHSFQAHAQTEKKKKFPQGNY